MWVGAKTPTFEMARASEVWEKRSHHQPSPPFLPGWGRSVASEQTRQVPLRIQRGRAAGGVGERNRESARELHVTRGVGCLFLSPFQNLNFGGGCDDS